MLPYSPCRVKRPETLHFPYRAFNWAVVWLRDIVQIANGPTTAASAEPRVRLGLWIALDSRKSYPR